jgi:hypothetical protein
MEKSSRTDALTMAFIVICIVVICRYFVECGVHAMEDLVNELCDSSGFLRDILSDNQEKE